MLPSEVDILKGIEIQSKGIIQLPERFILSFSL